MRAHVFVDETKASGFVVAAAIILPTNLALARQTIRKLILPGQRRIHFHKEKDARRRQLVTAMTELDVQSMIYAAHRYDSTKRARDACLVELVNDLAKMDAERLVLERDDSTLKADQKLLYQQVRTAGAVGNLRYDHLRAHEECLLAIPDAVAWCWARGGQWRNSVRRMITEIREV